MKKVVDLKEAKLLLAVKRGFRNWKGRFQQDFDIETRLSDVSAEALSFLAQGREKGSFYIYDLIMSLQNLGSGFEFDALNPGQKMAVIDRYLFLLDRIRFECMKRLGWLESYPGEGIPMVTLMADFERLAPSLQAEVPLLRSTHPGYREYVALHPLDREAFIRRLIPKAVKEIQDAASTL
jgi:hypothetical protein